MAHWKTISEHEHWSERLNRLCKMKKFTDNFLRSPYIIEYLNEIIFSTLMVDIVPDTISTRTKSITCNIWPPDGYDVTQIDTDSIRLNPEIWPARVSVRKKQQMLVVKFPTSELTLEPDTILELTVIGEITDGPTFEGTDSVAVVKKGGKPS